MRPAFSYILSRRKETNRHQEGRIERKELDGENIKSLGREMRRNVALWWAGNK